jgi:4,5:9,10-diseco-3-hydroxy-5,9,17-trioxoandrosta-1(10),2-diene-4-oate hydrolase
MGCEPCSTTTAVTARAAKLVTFVREYLVNDGAAVPDELIDLRYEASIQPEVVADPPLRRPSPGAVRTLLRMDFTRDRRLARLRTPTLVIWGANDKVNRPAGGRSLARTMPNCGLYLAARAGHWVQWERSDLFNALAVDFLAGEEGTR